MKIKELFKKQIIKDILINLICLTIVVIFLILFKMKISLLENKMLIQYINISSMVILLTGLTLFEIGYRKSKNRIIINGIEFIIFAIFTLLIKHIPKISNYTIQDYAQIVIYIYIIYYILKLCIIYTKMQYDKMKSLSDIKEIVKEEPIRKASKRKNIKEEGI